MFCTKCGYLLEDGVRFCTACGAEKDDCRVEAFGRTDRQDGESAGCSSRAEGFGSVVSASSARYPDGRVAERRTNGLGASKGIIAVAAVCVVVLAVAVGVLISPLLSGSSNPGNASNLEGASASQVSGATDAEEPVKSQADKADSSGFVSSEGSSGDSSPKSKESSQSAQDERFILPDSDSRYYTESELRAMSLEELYYARNEIYARHGRGFKNADLAAYFKGRSWYVKRYEPDEFDAMLSPLNEYEKKNADLMLQIEQQQDSSYLD